MLSLLAINKGVNYLNKKQSKIIFYGIAEFRVRIFIFIVPIQSLG